MTLTAGFGRGVITPTVPVMLAGFGARTEPAHSVHDDLEVRVLVVRDGTVGVALVVCDLLGMTAGFADPVRAAVGELLDLPRAAVLTACIHTHGGPNTMEGGEKLGWPTPEGYLDILVAGAKAAAAAAEEARQPASLFFARDRLPGELSHNRRGLPYDPTFAVLDVRRPDGSRIGTVANVSIHPVALGPQCRQVSSDWAGVFRTSFEDVTGAEAILLSGPLGDVNPVEGHVHHEEGNFDDAERTGLGVAVAVEHLARQAQPAGTGIGAVTNRTITVTPGTTLLTALTGMDGVEQTVELVEWRLGDVLLLSIPGEAFSAFDHELRAARGDEVVLAGLAPVWQGYLPTPYGEGYEESVSWGPDAVGAILRAIVAGPG